MATPTIRKGQTARDRANNKAARNKANIATRAAWQNGRGLSASQKASNDNFPKETCNGKKNRRKV